MGYKLTGGDRQIIKWLTKLPVPDETKELWLSTLNQSGMNDDIAGEMQKAIMEFEGSDRTRYLAELTQLIKQWRLANQTHNFRRRM